jgi:hypothetical protein
MIVVLSAAILGLNIAGAQTNLTNDYVIVSNGTVSDLTNYTVALDAADWENYRLQNERNSFSFENGLTFQVKSTMEMIAQGTILVLSNYPAALPAAYQPPILRLLSGNLISMEYTPLNYKSY